MLSPITKVRSESTMVDSLVPAWSLETRGRSEYLMIPFMAPSADALSTALTSSLLVPRATSSTMSTTDTLGVGTRMAMPLSLPFIGGYTRATAWAAPVEVGTIFTAAARARRRSRWLASRMRWSPV